MRETQWWRTATQYRVTIVLLVLIVLLLLIVTVPKPVLDLFGPWGATVSNLAPNLLASLLVSLLFDWFARKEVLSIVGEKVAEHEDRIVQGVIKGRTLPQPGDPLLDLWHPFVTKPTSIVISGDAQGVTAEGRPNWVVRNDAVLAVWGLHNALLAQFAPTLTLNQVHLDVCIVDRHAAKPEDLPEGNLVVIGAPGANPIARMIMDQLQPSYYFRVKPGGFYMENSWVRPTEDPNEFGIWERDRTGRPEQDRPVTHRYPAALGDPHHEEGAIVLRGTVKLGDGYSREVLVFAGNSRETTNRAVGLATTDRDWARQVNQPARQNVESLIVFRGQALNSKPSMKVRVIDAK